MTIPAPLRRDIAPTRHRRLLLSLATAALTHGVLAQQTPPAAQTPQSQAAPAQPPATAQPTAPARSGDDDQAAPAVPQVSKTDVLKTEIHGTIQSGNTPLPGVTVTATNTLTGQKFASATDVNGNYSINISGHGRYVLRADFFAFAPMTKEIVIPASLSATPSTTPLTMPSAAPSKTTPAISAPASPGVQNFTLVLASRQQAADARETAGNGNRGGYRQFTGGGAQNLGLLSAAADALASGASSGFGGSAGASLPTISGNTDFSGDSVAVAGQAGSSNPFAGVDVNQLRNNFEDMQQSQQLGQIPGGSQAGGGGFGGGGFGGGPGGGGPGGGGGGRGGGGGGRGGFNFRNFNPSQPHGAFFWTGGNGAINAKDYALQGQPIEQPAYGSNQYGATFIGNPSIPHLFKDTKDFIFLTLAGQRSSSPFDEYATVPTEAERSGIFGGLTTPGGLPITIYDPTTGKPFADNAIPAARLLSAGNRAPSICTAAEHHHPRYPAELSAPHHFGNQHRYGWRAVHSQFRRRKQRPHSRHDPPVCRLADAGHPAERQLQFQLQSHCQGQPQHLRGPGR